MLQAPKFLSQGPRRQPEAKRSAAADFLSGLGLLVGVGLVYFVGIVYLTIKSLGFSTASPDAVAAAQAAGERASDTQYAYWIAAFLTVTLVIAILAVRRNRPWTAGLHFCAAAFLALQLAVVTQIPQADRPTPAPPGPAVPVCRSGSICP